LSPNIVILNQHLDPVKSDAADEELRGANVRSDVSWFCVLATVLGPVWYGNLSRIVLNTYMSDVMVEGLDVVTLRVCAASGNLWFLEGGGKEVLVDFFLDLDSEWLGHLSRKRLRPGWGGGVVTLVITFRRNS
jgi:hypothetical protein